MAQQNIDFGTFPDDPSADAIRTAFQKVQQNFTEVYGSLTSTAVRSVNRTAGPGITVNAPTGNVVVTANIASVSISSVTLKVGTSPNPVTNNATYTSYSQTLYIEIPNNLAISTLSATGNITANGNLAVSNANLGNAATANFFIGDGSQISNITANTANTSNVAGTVSQNAQSNITSLGTLTSLSVSGNIIAGNIYANAGIIGAQYFKGDGSNLSNIQVSNVSGTIANANYAAYAGNVINASQSNITVVGSLASLSVVGNADVGNIGATNGVFTNVSGNGANLSSIAGANVTGTVANATYATIANSVAGANVFGTVSSATTADTVTTNAQPNITSTGTLTTVSVSGNANIGNVGTGIITATGTITGGNLSTTGTLSVGGNTTVGNLSVTGTLNAGDITVGSISNGTSNVDIVGVSGNVITSVAGVANVLVVTSTGANIAGTLSASGNISAGNVTATTFTGALSGAATSATTAGTVTTASQPNITSTGTLASLSVSGVSTLGAVGNVKITGGTGFLQGDGAGNLTFVSVVTQTIPGVANSILLSDGTNNITATSNIKFNDPQLDITGTLSVTGNANVGNIGATNILGTIKTANQPNITSVGTLSSLILGGNLNSNSDIITNSGNISAFGNVTGAFILGNGSSLSSITGSNVTGAVSYATTANSVALANVSGAGNIASININGNSSQILYGNGVFAAASVTYGNSDVATFLASYGSNTITTTGNITAGNINSTLLTGTLTTGAQPNITSTGILTSLSVSGNANVGGNLNVTGTGSFNANVNMNTKWINNVGYPNLSTDVATKLYVDTLVSSGISYHTPVYVATTTTLATATGGTTSYVSPNGAANGIGAYISTTGTYLNIDSANIQTVGTRILVKDESNAAWNGIYTYANTTAIVRSTDTDESGTGSTELLGINDYFFTTNGTVNKGVAFVVSAPAGTITFGTSNITFAIFSSSQVYSAGTGINITGTVISANASQTQVTAVGNLTSLSVVGNANVGNIGATNGVFTNVSGNGSALTSITGGNVTGQVGNALVAGTVYTNAQPNITSVGTLTSLSASGNITGANIITTNYLIRSVATSISAAGSTQGTGTVLAKEFNQVSTVASGAGVVLPVGVPGLAITITNSSANSVIVYPASGASINALATNAGYTHPTLATLQYITLTGTQWYTVGATYA